MNTEPHQFVSRGGIKLQHAIEQFSLNVQNLVVLDIGSSTGGFVDCLLQNGAAKVYAVDTAYGEFAWKLRNDPRVVVMERTNILHLDSLPGPKEGSDPRLKIVPSEVGSRLSEGSDPSLVDLVTIDASWTKLEKILPVVEKFLKPGGQIVALLKPHYQADKSKLVKGVLEESEALKVKEKVELEIRNLKFEIGNSIESPILGGGGNREYLLLLTKS
jgi:23S rRNA (cytidine1920-2'-O)/16S rRNA (cytidine1409-2'-O)-methyltransferase